MSHRTTIRVSGRKVATLADILPAEGPMLVLMIAKTPAPESVEAGHYFQGHHGRMLWNRLREYGLLDVPHGTFEDDVLLAHGYGLTDVAKLPRAFGEEPSDDEYREGLARVIQLIAALRPRVVIFVYKRVLDQALKLSFGRRTKSIYGFNDDLEHDFGSRVFVFPMPGTPCTKAQARAAMTELAGFLG